jgi:hypothetical protein
MNILQAVRTPQNCQIFNVSIKPIFVHINDLSQKVCKLVISHYYKYPVLPRYSAYIQWNCLGGGGVNPTGKERSAPSRNFFYFFSFLFLSSRLPSLILSLCFPSLKLYNFCWFATFFSFCYDWYCSRGCSHPNSLKICSSRIFYAILSVALIGKCDLSLF